MPNLPIDFKLSWFQTRPFQTSNIIACLKVLYPSRKHVPINYFVDPTIFKVLRAIWCKPLIPGYEAWGGICTEASMHNLLAFMMRFDLSVLEPWMLSPAWTICYFIIWCPDEIPILAAALRIEYDILMANTDVSSTSIEMATMREVLTTISTSLAALPKAELARYIDRTRMWFRSDKFRMEMALIIHEDIIGIRFAGRKPPEVEKQMKTIFHSFFDPLVGIPVDMPDFMPQNPEEFEVDQKLNEINQKNSKTDPLQLPTRKRKTNRRSYSPASKIIVKELPSSSPQELSVHSLRSKPLKSYSRTPSTTPSTIKTSPKAKQTNHQDTSSTQIVASPRNNDTRNQVKNVFSLPSVKMDDFSNNQSYKKNLMNSPTSYLSISKIESSESYKKNLMNSPTSYLSTSKIELSESYEKNLMNSPTSYLSISKIESSEDIQMFEEDKKTRDNDRKSSAQLYSVTFREAKSDDLTVVVINFYDEQFPYRTKIPGHNITLKQFKEALPKKGSYRYFFKTECEDLDVNIIQEEITHDADIIPLWEGKIMAEIKTMQ